jgi:hypothetical protein
MDGEAVLSFPPELLDLVAQRAGARVKRRLSPEKRERLIKAGKSTRFKTQKMRHSG